jgi:hypothetical protein
VRHLAILLALSTIALGDARAHQPLARDPPASWEGAAPLVLARPSDACSAVKLGEWARITCTVPGWIIDVRLVGGSHEGVFFRPGSSEGSVQLILRLAPGDRREIAVATRVPDLGYTVEEATKVVASELWLAGEAEPTIAVARYE